MNQDEPAGHDESSLVKLAESLGDVPPLPGFDVWKRAQIEEQINSVVDSGAEVPAGLLKASAEQGRLFERATTFHMSAGLPLLGSPFLQVTAARRINALRPAIEAGDGSATLEAVACCLAHAMVAPGWLAGAFIDRFQRAALGESKSWDVAFGPAIPAGTNQGGVKARKQLAPLAYDTALELLGLNPGRAIDKGFFDEIGKKIGRGETVTEGLIRTYVRESNGAFPNPADLKPFLESSNGNIAAAVLAWGDAKHRQQLKGTG